MFIKGQTSELAWMTSFNIPSPLYLFLKVLPPVYICEVKSQRSDSMPGSDIPGQGLRRGIYFMINFTPEMYYHIPSSPSV